MAMNYFLRSVYVTLLIFPLFTHSQEAAAQAGVGVEEQVVIETITISAGAESEYGEVDIGYAVGIDSGSETLKMGQPVYRTPRAISIITRDIMDDRGDKSISESLQYSPGIFANSAGETNKSDGFLKIRGFKATNEENFIDGLRLFSSQWFAWKIDPAAVERVEFIRGPAADLFGQTSSGGIVNTITKRPILDEDIHSLTFTLGEHDRRAVSFDMNKNLNTNDGSQQAVRVVGTKRKNGHYVDEVETEVDMISPSFRYKNDKVDYSLNAFYQRDDGNQYHQWLGLDGLLVPLDGQYVDYDQRIFDDPDNDRLKREQMSLTSELEYKVDDSLKFVQKTRYGKINLDVFELYNIGSVTKLVNQFTGLDLPVVPASLRSVVTYKGNAQGLSLDNQLHKTWERNKLKHKLLAGVDYQKLKFNEYDYYLGAGSISPDPIYVPFNNGIPNPFFNPLNPVRGDSYGLFNLSTLSFLSDADLVLEERRSSQLGAYLQYQLDINERFLVKAGVRHDMTDSKITREAAGVNIEQDPSKTTFNAALAYYADNGLMPYISYTQSFAPVVDLDENDQPFEPTTGEGYELGFKYKPENLNGYLAFSVFDIQKQKEVQFIPPNSFQQIGEVGSKGAEVEVVADLSSSTSLSANVSWLDATVEEDTNPNKVGKRVVEVPEWSSAAWLHHRVLDGPLSGLGMGLGVRYIGEKYGDAFETVEVPDITLFDASLNYQWDNVNFKLTGKNITDKRYVASCLGSCWYGDPRSVNASVNFTW